MEREQDSKVWTEPHALNEEATVYQGYGFQYTGEFNWPLGLCVDDQDRLWVCDFHNKRLQLGTCLFE